MHLNTEDLVDIAEGTRPESSAPHLAACARCRAQLVDLRAMLSAAKDVAVPEPSPLFWGHLSSRVSAAVAAEPAARLKPARYIRSWTETLIAVRAYAFVTVAAAVLIAAVLSSRVQAPAPLPPAPIGVTVRPPAVASDAIASVVLLDDAALQNDASLMLVATLSDGVDFETAREAGLAPRDSAEHAVTHMNDAELRELRRLLTEELARSGA
jgi:hypothetical protein